MANRKFRHNVNEARIINSSNSDLNGNESYFKFEIETSAGSIADTTGSLHLGNLFATSEGLNTDLKQFNYSLEHFSGKVVSFNHNNEIIGDINDAFADPSNVNEINPPLYGVTDWAETTVTVTIKGQFGQLNLWGGSDNAALGGGASSDHLMYLDPNRQSEGIILEEYELIITQWGDYNKITDMNQWCELSGSGVVITATDEPRFTEGASLYKMGKGSNDLFTEDAIASIKSWDFDKISSVGRLLENNTSLDLSGVSISGANNDMAYYMRTFNPHLDKGKSVRTTSVRGWAGYVDDSLSDTFQGSNIVHDWSELNTGQVTDFSYFAWHNTKDSGFDYSNFDTHRGVDFTGMFGYAHNTDVDPSNWDMSSAKTLFFMLGMETGASPWSGELNWKTMRNVNDLHSVVKNRTFYNGDRLDEFAQYSGNVVLFRSAFAGTNINYDFSNWDFSGVDATRTDVALNENNSSGIMGGFVRDCSSMSLTNLVKLMEACDRPFGQGGLPVSGVDPEIGTSVPNSFEFGNSYGDSKTFGFYNSEIAADPTLLTRGLDAMNSLKVKGYTMGGLTSVFVS